MKKKERRGGRTLFIPKKDASDTSVGKKNTCRVGEASILTRVATECRFMRTLSWEKVRASDTHPPACKAPMAAIFWEILA
jgi:hypothetical protein